MPTAAPERSTPRQLGRLVDASKTAGVYALVVTAVLCWKMSLQRDFWREAPLWFAWVFAAVFVIVLVGRLAGAKTAREARPTDLTATPLGRWLVGAFFAGVLGLIAYVLLA